MKSLVILAFALAVGLTATGASAQSQCADFDVLGNGARVSYQPFDNQPTVDNFDIRVRRIADGVAAVRFVLVDTTPGSTGPGLGQFGPDLYDIVWLADADQRVLVVGTEQPMPQVGAIVALPGRNGNAITRFRLSIPAGQRARATIHAENLAVRYACLDGNGNQVGSAQQQGAPVTISATVPRYAAAYVGSVGQTRGAIAFGNVSATGAALTQSAVITALSTLPYDVAITSDNDGKLRRIAGDPAGIAYSMQFGGAAVESGQTVTCPITDMPAGDSQRLEVTLEPQSIGQQPAGNYADVITLTFQPRDTQGVDKCAILP